jgi:uncharacterized membrane protein YgcG
MTANNITIQTKAAKNARRRTCPAAILVLALLFFLLFTGDAPHARAATAGTDVTLTVKQVITVNGVTVAPETSPGTAFRYILKPLPREGHPAPLPEGEEGAEGYAFEIAGTAEKQITIPFTGVKGGVCGYTLKCEEMTEKDENYSLDDESYILDDESYSVKVYVYRVSQVAAVVWREKKIDENDETRVKIGDEGIVFTHAYTGPTGEDDEEDTDDGETTGNGGNNGSGSNGSGEGTGSGGESANPPAESTETTDPSDDATESEGATDPPGPSEGSSLVFLDNGNYLEIDKNGVPLGEWHLDEETGEWVFEEYLPPLAAASDALLPQTGQLRWPVPALGSLGALLFLIGAALNARRAGREPL